MKSANHTHARERSHTHRQDEQTGQAPLGNLIRPKAVPYSSGSRSWLLLQSAKWFCARNIRAVEFPVVLSELLFLQRLLHMGVWLGKL